VCPICLQHDETISHVLTCSHPSCQTIWIEQVESLCLWMIQVDTAPDIISCFIPTLLHLGSLSFSSHASAFCHQAALEQDSIGFFGCMVGRLSSSWNSIQASYYSSQCSQRSAMLWAVCFCHQLLQFTHHIWCTRNDQVQVAHQRLASQALQHDILAQFQLGAIYLLPADQFYITPGPTGFLKIKYFHFLLMISCFGYKQFVMLEFVDKNSFTPLWDVCASLWKIGRPLFIFLRNKVCGADLLLFPTLSLL